MAVSLKVGDRLLRVEKSPFPPDDLIAVELFGEEGFSQLYQFRLRVLSSRDTLLPKDVLGKGFTVSIRRLAAQPRLIAGIAAHFSFLGTDDRGLSTYDIGLAPAFWQCTLRTNSRIFQNKSAKDIIETVLKDYPDVVYDDLGVREATIPRDYCVQYQETDFDFLSRLMEAEGIFYFFRHAQGGSFDHKAFFADGVHAYAKPEGEVELRPRRDEGSFLTAWTSSFATQPAAYTYRDYDFEKPSQPVELEGPSILKWRPAHKAERYLYQSGATELAEKKRLTKIAMERDEAAAEIVRGSGHYPFFAAGTSFQVIFGLPKGAETKYVLRSVHHSAQDYSQVSQDGASISYANDFICLPARIPYRSSAKTSRPTMLGPQLATVVGPQGEEIFTDSHGRVKVQFYWDRYGKHDEESSCWLRVSQAWAGQSWGGMSIPRIGQEVIVDFLEGDPDQPIITGRVYNGEQPPPYGLPGNATRTTLKSNSSKGGGGIQRVALRG